MMRRIAAHVFLTAVAASAQTATLKVGDPAPPLRTGAWVQGPAVAAIEPGNIYVLEFWSTSCVWCIPAMNHLSELAAKHPDVIFIGQDIFEDDDAAVKPFLAKVGGGKIAYRIALDDKSKDPDGEMNRTWFTAAGYDTMPATIVVGKDARIAWTGRPDDVDPVLDGLIAGTFDPKAAAEAQAKAAALDEALKKAIKNGDLDAALRATQGLRQAKPADADAYAAFDINLLYRNGRPDAARTQTATLVGASKQAKVLNTVAWGIAVMDAPTPADLALARQAVDRSLELGDRKDGTAFDTSARLHAMTGAWDQAVADQQQGLGLAIGDDNKSLARTALDAYRKKELPALK